MVEFLSLKHLANGRSQGQFISMPLGLGSANKPARCDLFGKICPSWHFFPKEISGQHLSHTSCPTLAIYNTPRWLRWLNHVTTHSPVIPKTILACERYRHLIATPAYTVHIALVRPPNIKLTKIGDLILRFQIYIYIYITII